MDSRLFRYIVLGIGGLILLLLILLLIFLLLDDDPGDAAPATTTSSAETTTTAAGTTTTAAVTTTTVVETTTTAAETTTTVVETTTTAAALDPLVLADDGIGGVDFGASPEATIAYVSAILGPPDVDTGWIDAFSNPYGVCPEPVVRGAEWGTGAGGFAPSFIVLFTDSTTTHASGEHFFGYFYFGGSIPLATVEGITTGSTNLMLETEIPSAVINESPFDPSAGSWASNVDPTDQDLLWGFSTSADPSGTLTSVNGGSACGE
ncbi:MAG: hypothetical protein BMS9Abin07_2250 [Acidimicrobiia bacterium]|nr:MAG: hypothetical protein BMS9Abin07_2250 [Acidimicrobiia bacterium]